MPFTTQEARNMTDAIGPQVVGDRCFLAYREMVRKWNASRRWTTAHEIYAGLMNDRNPMFPEWGHPDDLVAKELAWQVFFIEKVMPYEQEMRALNGDVL